jgi:hypothetical protein
LLTLEPTLKRVRLTSGQPSRPLGGTDHGGSQSTKENRTKRQTIERARIIFPAGQLPNEYVVPV